MNTPRIYDLLWAAIKALLPSLGSTWLVISLINYLREDDSPIPFWNLAGLTLLFMILAVLYDGLLGRGFLRKSIELVVTSFDTKITIKFGDVFKQSGWIVIPVNDFFDSIVDDKHISKSSLHGMMLDRYWKDDCDAWDAQIEKALGGYHFNQEERTSGKNKRFKIGTTARCRKNSNCFLCMALTRTNTKNLETKTTPEELVFATKKMLKKARSFCSGEKLSIPVIGAGLSRTGLRQNVLIHLILTAIFDETKTNKITNEIQIVISENFYSQINLANIKKEWI